MFVGGETTLLSSARFFPFLNFFKEVKAEIMSKKFVVLDSNKKNFTKEEIAEREALENKASDGFSEMQITAPNHLSPQAKAEYKRVVEDLQRLPLRNLDRAMLENYCTWYSIYKDCSKILTEQGSFLEDGSPNPAINSLEKATKNIKQCASELGLTVDSRMKMFVPKQEEKKETLFDKFGS